MLVGASILAVLTIFGSCWAYQMARYPKDWRLWWLHALSVVEINASRERRKKQELIIMMGSSAMCLLCALTAVFCIYRAVLEVQEQRRDKTLFEKDQETTRREIEIMRSKKTFQKLN